MAFELYYNDRFPLRMVNFVKKYLEAGGMIRVDNRIVSQLSKLQVIDYFYPSLFVKKVTDSSQEAEYLYDACYIAAPVKQGVLSNWGSYKQKINNLEDCILGNSRNEKTYKNYTAARNMLRRAASDLLSHEALCRGIITNLRSIYRKQLTDIQREDIRIWLEKMIHTCQEKKTIQICTAERTDGLSFDRDIYNSLIERVSSLYDEGNFEDCWTWFCLGSVFGNYSGPLMKKYRPDFSLTSSGNRQSDSYRLIPSAPEIVKPFFCGRDDDLNKIHEMFTDGSHVIFLYGIGGIGKTELARQYAAKFRNEYDVIIHAVYEGSLKDLVISDMPFETEPEVPRMIIGGVKESDEAYFRRKLEIIKKASGRKTLIILDDFNVERDDFLNEFIHGRYHLLITTRFDYSLDYPSLKIKEIEDMDSLVSIFMHHYRGYAVEPDDPDLISLIKAVNNHTFTVILLARHMENSGQSAAEMLEALNQKGIVSLNEKVRISDTEPDEAYLNLIRMFDLFDFSEDEQRVLQLLSLIPITGVPPMIFTEWADLHSTKILINLENRGWISRTSGGIALHPVVRKVLQYVLPVHPDKIRSFLDHAASALANEKSWHYTKQQKEQYCLIAKSITGILNTIDENTVSFVQSAAVLFSYSGYAEEAEQLDKKLYQYRADHDGIPAFETARAAYRIGWNDLFNRYRKDSLSNAEEWLTLSREQFEQLTLKTTDQKAMYCGLLENLSKYNSLRYEQTKKKKYLEAAERDALRAVTLSRKWLKDYSKTGKSPAGSLLRLADVYIQTRKYSEAYELILEAYDILSSIHSEEDPDILRATSKKAKVLYYLGKYEDSLNETEQNLTLYRKFHGTNNPSCFDQLILKIRNCLQLGMTETAMQTKEEALQTAEKLFPEDKTKTELLNELI